MKADECMTEEAIYERIVELNHCMAQLTGIMKPLRDDLVRFSAEFNKYAKEKDRLERQLIQVKYIPAGMSGRKHAPAQTSEQLLEAQLSTLAPDKLEELLARIKNKLKGGGE